jgi:hypothetical protein
MFGISTVDSNSLRRRNALSSVPRQLLLYAYDDDGIYYIFLAVEWDWFNLIIWPIVPALKNENDKKLKKSKAIPVTGHGGL